MSKAKSIYICQSCGYESTKWMGQCQECGSWNSFVETQLAPSTRSSSGSNQKRVVTEPVSISKIAKSELKRISTNIKEFDRVIGGGFVPGQVVLLAGTPGIGKSTILTQLARDLKDSSVIYVAGEESPSQIKIRTERMNYKAENLFVLSETDVDLISDSIESYNKTNKVGLVIVDSIQTLFSADLTGMAGSVGQVRGSTQKLVNMAKRSNIPTVLVGHVTKEGTVAGPKVLEHMVDTVLYLEGDSNHLFRILKTDKNRFGPVSEVGIFQMEESGMSEVSNPSELFLGDPMSNTSGSCVTAVMEGYRPLLFEIQALTVKTSFGYPKRTASGFSINRLHVIIATLEKRCGIDLYSHDVYLSVSGGYKVSEYSCDLAVCLALASSVKDKPLKERTVAFGEIDLSGGVRKVPYQDVRTKESSNMGYANVISPQKVKTIIQAIKLAF